MSAALAAQASLALVAACPYAGRRARRSLGPVVTRWRQDRAWARGLRAVHDEHYLTSEPEFVRVLAEVRYARLTGAPLRPEAAAA